MKSRIFLIIVAISALAMTGRAQSPNASMIDTISTSWKSDTLLANDGIHTQIFNNGLGVLYIASSPQDTLAYDSKNRAKFIVIQSGSNVVFGNTVTNKFWFKSSSSSAVLIVRY